MTISSTVRMQLTTSQVESPQDSTLSLASNADYKTRISSTTGKLYEVEQLASAAFKTINLTSDVDLIGNTLGFTTVYAIHLENKGVSSVYVDGTASTVDFIGGDITLAKQGCLAYHCVYGNAVAPGSDVIVINPNGTGSFTIRIIGA